MVKNMDMVKYIGKMGNLIIKDNLKMIFVFRRIMTYNKTIYNNIIHNKAKVVKVF